MEIGFYTIIHGSPGLYPPLEKISNDGEYGTYRSLIYIFELKRDSTYKFNHVKYFIWNNKKKKWQLGVKTREDIFKGVQEFTDKRFLLQTIFESKSLSNSFNRAIMLFTR